MKVYPGFGPARHSPLSGDWAMPRHHLRPDGPARHSPFLFRVVSGHAPEGTSLAKLRPGRAGMAVGWVYVYPCPVGELHTMLQ
jgi:hypothetical protein